MRTETTETKNKKGNLPPPTKKRNATILKMEAGDKFTGIFKGKSVAPWLDHATGETKDLTRLHFISENGERVVIFEDAGLRNAMANSQVLEDETITLVKLEKTDLKGGRSVNQWDIYSA